MLARTFKMMMPSLKGVGKLNMGQAKIASGMCKPLSARLYSAEANYIKELKSPEEWEKDVFKKIQDGPTILEFYAKWCGPCKTLDPVIQKNVKDAAGKINLVKVNIDECGDIAREYGVKAIPHIALIHKGNTVDQFVGVSNDEMIIKFFSKAKQLAEGK